MPPKTAIPAKTTPKTTTTSSSTAPGDPQGSQQPPPTGHGGHQILQPPAQPPKDATDPWPAGDRPVSRPANPYGSIPLTQPVVPDANNPNLKYPHYMTTDLDGGKQDVYLNPKFANQGQQMKAGQVQNMAAGSGQMGTNASMLENMNHNTRNDPRTYGKQIPADYHTGGTFSDISQSGSSDPPKASEQRYWAHAYNKSEQVDGSNNQKPIAALGADDVKEKTTAANVEAWRVQSRDGVSSYDKKPLKFDNQIIPPNTYTAANDYKRPSTETQPDPKDFKEAEIPKWNPWGVKPTAAKPESATQVQPPPAQGQQQQQQQQQGRQQQPPNANVSGSGREAITDDVEGETDDEVNHNDEQHGEGFKHGNRDNQEEFEHDQERHYSEHHDGEHISEHYHERHSSEHDLERDSSAHHYQQHVPEDHNEWDENEHKDEHQHDHEDFHYEAEYEHKHEHEHEHEHHDHQYGHEDENDVEQSHEHGYEHELEQEYTAEHEHEHDFEHEAECENEHEEGEADEQDEESHYSSHHSHLAHIKDKIHDFVHEMEVGEDYDEDHDHSHHEYEHGHAQEVY